MRIIIIFSFAIFFGRVLNAQDKGSDKSLLPTFISGHLSTGQSADTVTLELFDEFTIHQEASNAVWKQQIITRNGDFTFKLPALAKGSCFGIYNSNNGFRSDQLKLVNYPVNPGDSLQIVFNKHETKFSGRGSEKVICFSGIRERAWERIRSPIFSELIVNPGNLIGFMRALDYVATLELDILNSFKDQLDSFDYNILKANIEGEAGLEKYQYAKKYLDGPDTLIRNALLKDLTEYLINNKVDTTCSFIRRYADQYIDYAVVKLECDYRWKKILISDTFNVLHTVCSQYTGLLRDKIILEYINRRAAWSELTEQDLQVAMQIVNTEIYSEKLRELDNILGKGKAAINFEFKNPKDKVVRLSDFRGKIVFMDMWFSGCSGCVSVANAMPDVEEAFAKNPDVVFLSISIDSDRALWLRSIAPKSNENGNSGEMHAGYSHFTTKTTKYLFTGGRGSDDPFIRAYIPSNTYPHLLLIDKSGKIIAANPPRPDLNNGKRDLIELIREAESSR